MADSEIELETEMMLVGQKMKRKVLEKYHPGLVILKDDGMMGQITVQLEH